MKLEVILQELKKANDKVENIVMEFVIKRLREKGYVTFKEIIEPELLPVSKIKQVIEEIAKSLDLTERRNGN